MTDRDTYVSLPQASFSLAVATHAIVEPLKSPDQEQQLPFVPAANPSNSQPQQQQQPSYINARLKREVRLLRNKEAAKECRRKKKDYLHCLESRVTELETTNRRLETQNKKLIEELNTLKELYRETLLDKD